MLTSSALPTNLPCSSYSSSSSHSNSSSISSTSMPGRTNPQQLAPMPLLAPALRFLASQNMLTGGYIEPALAAPKKFFMNSPTPVTDPRPMGQGMLRGTAPVPSVPSHGGQQRMPAGGPIRRRTSEKSSVPISTGKSVLQLRLLWSSGQHLELLAERFWFKSPPLLQRFLFDLHCLANSTTMSALNCLVRSGGKREDWPPTILGADVLMGCFPRSTPTQMNSSLLKKTKHE